MFALIRRKESHAGRADQITTAGDDNRPRRQIRPHGQRIGQRFCRLHLAQPVVQHGLNGRRLAAHLGGQRCHGRLEILAKIEITGQHYTQPCFRPVVQPFVKLGRIVTGDGAQAFAQYRFDGLFPARFDMNLLP